MGLLDRFKKSFRSGHEDSARFGTATAVLEPQADAPQVEVDAPQVEADALDLTGTWVIDPSHSSIGFTARHAMVTNVRGTFDEYQGRGLIDGVNPAASSATVVMQAASINTGSADRDGHLRSADFFDVETHPELRFASTSVERVSPEIFRVTGDLTIKDVTRPVSIDFTATGLATDPFGNLRAGFEGGTTINRKDWGLEWNAALETGGVLVSEKIKLVFDISAIKES